MNLESDLDVENIVPMLFLIKLQEQMWKKKESKLITQSAPYNAVKERASPRTWQKLHLEDKGKILRKRS